MGGGGPKIKVPTLREVAGFATLGSNLGGLAAAASTSADVQQSTQAALDSSGLNPAANITKIEDEVKQAEGEQKKKEADINEGKIKADEAKRNAAKRNRQRSLMGQSGGRSGTILTGGLGVEGTGSGTGKTLLGS